MNSAAPAPASNAWFAFALITVVTWGVYGILLHKGQVAMADPVNGRMKAFLFVGIAYFLVAVLAPLAILKGAAFSNYPTAGWSWSLIAGVAGAVGAFGTLLAFGAKGRPPEVMAIVFAGAPVINAIVSLYISRHEIDFSNVSWKFYVGIALALVGGALVTLYKPNPAPKKPGVAQVSPARPAVAKTS